MNDADIEALLTRLPPRAPSARLTHQVARDLELDQQWLPELSRRPRIAWLKPLTWSSLGAAAALIIATLSPIFPNQKATQTTALAPSVKTVHEIVEAQDQDILFNPESHLPERRVRLRIVERQSWTDPRDGAQITIEQPHEDHVLLPASFQ
jgi:hypothetical protein